VTVFDTLIVERHYIECDGNSPFFWRRKIEGSAVEHKGRGVDSRVPHLGLQLAYASNTSARYSLIRTNHHSLQAGGLMQWLEHRHCRLSPAKIHIPGADAVAKAEGYTNERASASAWRTRRGRRTWHVWKLVAREPGGPHVRPVARKRSGLHREGEEP